MAVANASLVRLKKFMEDSGFTHTMEWLGACVDWIQENYPGADFQVLQREVLDQWKDANLEEMESMCLPRGLAGQKLVEIPAGKKYGLQLNTIRDIGESSYSQWTKIKKLENENATVAATDSNEVKPAWQPAPKRCLYLDMTDGTQQVFGMEMNPIKGLSLDLKAGAKIIIVGPVNCRRGVFHLKPNNVVVVGGEVEDLVETNKTEKILARILNIAVDDSRYPQPPSTPITSSSLSTASTVRVGSDVISGDFPDDSEDQFPDMEAFGEDDSLFMEIDEEEIISSATSASSSIAKPHAKQNSSTSKSVFVPPSTVISSANKKSVPTTTPLFSSNKSSSSKSASSTTTSKANQNPSTSGSDFKTAKSALASSSNSTSKAKEKGNGKQLNILQYMKPMPVTIDPPTPERRLKRQRKSVEEGVPIKHEQDRKPSIKTEPICDTTILLNSDEDDISEEQHPEDELPNFEEEDFFVNSPDASLMRIVDQAVEDRFMEGSQDDVKPKDLKPVSEDFATKESGSTSANVNKNKTPYPRKVPGHPYVFIQQIEASLKEHLVPQKVATVKACISTIVSNINIEGECWKLEVSLNDGTGYLNCQMCSNLLNTIIGFSPVEMKAIKAQKTKEGKRKISEAMNGLATKLVHLNGLFSIEIGKQPQPLVINISELMPHHSVALKDRLKQIGLE